MNLKQSTLPSTEFDFDKVFDEILLIEDGQKEYKTWTEDFEDEETHEIVKVERNECVSLRQPTPEEAVRIEKLTASILPHVKELSDEQLYSAYCYDNRLVYLLEAMSRGLEWALEDDGDDVNFITYRCTTDDTAKLDSIEKFIDDLCKEYGMPENVEVGLPMNIPYSVAMRHLTGDDRFKGLIEKDEREGNVLTIRCSCTERCINAFADALRDSFNVTVKNDAS